MTDHATTARAIAAEVRAEMARQNKTRAGLAEALGVTAHTAGRKASGATDFTVVELAQVAIWLDIPLPRLFAAGNEAAAS